MWRKSSEWLKWVVEVVWGAERVFGLVGCVVGWGLGVEVVG